MKPAEEKAQRYRERMRRKKAVIDANIDRATEERGIVIVLTGNGKGKSSSGFGMVARALGHDMKVAVVQFIKGGFSTGEEAFFRRFPDEVEYHVMGEGFTWETQDKSRDIATAGKAWEKALQFLRNRHFDMVLLDELNIVIKLGYLPLEEVIEALQQRPEMQHVIVTGRGADRALIEVADTVTEMRDIKHAYRAGIKAQKGVEL
jgi:cob(I)alamin adenosyltransferase